MKAIVMVLLVLTGQTVIAQNWQEWTQQKKTQIKYLTQQIGGLKVYLGYAKKGYNIAQTGLKTIRNIKEGDLALHDTFFASLKAVNPTIASSAKVAAVLARGVQIVREVKRTINGLRASGQFTPEEVSGYQKAFDGLMSHCTETVEELIHLVAAGHYEMRDDERLQRMEEVAKAMEGHYAFCVEQSSGLQRLALQRATEGVEIQYSKKLNAKQ